MMGNTGCGKTTFVNLAAGASFEVNHELGSCTQKVQSWTFPLEDETVTIIDTPGFNDIERPQMEVLEQIATFLEESYQSQKKLAGVIYLQRISDIRMSGAAIQNYRLFRKKCGDMAMENVVIVTNMWSEVSPKTGAIRERELRYHYFKDALTLGARMYRHDNTLISAQRILLDILQNRSQAAQFQDEMVVQQQMTSRETAVALEPSILAEVKEYITPPERRIIVVMGSTGCGKTTVSRAKSSKDNRGNSLQVAYLHISL